MTPMAPEARQGGRVLREGQVVRVRGWRGTYTIRGFRGEDVELVGGPSRAFRTARLSQIGARPRRVEQRP